MSQKNIEDMNVLVVDDEEKICSLIKVFLETSFNFKSIVIATTVVQANQKLINQEFDLLITDHVLPGKLGIDFVRNLRQSVKFNRLKVILISGYLQQEDVLKAIGVGVRNVLVKPFTRQQLVQQVTDVLRIGLEKEEGDEVSEDHVEEEEKKED
jgi:two-component system, chemotaxis family, chemotaxis protein CheY